MEEGAGAFWKLYSCYTSLRKAASCCAICFVSDKLAECLPLVQLAALPMNLKNKLIVLPTSFHTHGEDLLPIQPNITQLSHEAADSKETRGRDRGRENYGGTHYNKSTTCWLFVQVEGERKRGGGVKGGSRGPQLMEGVICES